MYKKYYSEFLKHHSGKLHFAAHSHHFWPDVTREAQLQYWDDSARMSDEKWGHVFGTVIPETQKFIAEVLKLKHPEMISFAQSTHELISRLLSALDWTKEVHLLTTDSEFHSFKRQYSRLMETGKFKVDVVPSEPFDTLEARLLAAMTKRKYQMIFLSHVFFNSGVAIDFFENLDKAKSEETLFVIDAYHAFMALPTDLSKLEGKVFYLAGSYKYAQGGEGACFMISPKNCQLRPLYTGWFASFSSLEKESKQVDYDEDYYRFMGSTFDPSGIYRLRAVLKLFKNENLSVDSIHAHVKNLQNYFSQSFESKNIHASQILKNTGHEHGHFLTFKMESAEAVKSYSTQLKQKGVYTDFRGDRLRFGFGLYHDLNDVKELIPRL